MNKKNKYWYVYNNKKVANAIEIATGEPYMVFDMKDGVGKVYSFKQTRAVLIAYNAIQEVINIY